MYNLFNFKNIILLWMMTSGYLFSKVDFSTLQPTQSIVKLKYLKSTKSNFSIGNYVWFDVNQNGQQELGEMGLYHIALSLYDNATCQGTAVANMYSSDVGRYEFKNLFSTATYCLLAKFPENFRDLKSNGVSTKIENITLFSADMDFGFFHKSTTCNAPSLVENERGHFSTSGRWAKQATLNVDFEDVKAYAFCHEYTNHGPNTNDEYSAHLVDRLGFTSKQRDSLSRLFRYMSDQEIIEILERNFINQENDFFFNILSNGLVWYYSDWHESFARLERYIDESKGFKNLSKEHRLTLKKLAHLIIDKVAGVNGQIDYEPMIVYYLWNETEGKRQDLIVPQTSLVPLHSECSNPKIQIETSTNGIDADTVTGVAIPFAQAITWKYEVENTGNVPLKNVVLRDDKLGKICEFKRLNVSDSKLCAKLGKATVGQYVNIGTVTAESSKGVTVRDTDPSHYIGGEKLNSLIDTNVTTPIGTENPKPIIEIEVLINGKDSDNPTGEKIGFEENITLSYRVKNIGNVLLDTIVVTDSKLNEICKIATLEVGNSKTCNKKDRAVEGQQSHEGTVKATSPKGTEVRDSDKSYYFGEEHEPIKPQTKPIAKDDSKVGERCKLVVLNILTNDIDLDNDLNSRKVNFMVFAGANGVDSDNDGDIDTLIVPNEGTWKVSSTGQVTYLPNVICEGSPSTIQYTITDESEKVSNRATISVVYPDALKATLGDCVWFDADKNGKLDEGESGLQDITVELYDANNELNQSMKTDENGTYEFINLDAGEYSVKFVVKDGFSITVKNAEGVADVNNSDADAITGRTAIITLNEGDNRVDIDAGMYQIPKPSIKIVLTTNGGNVANIVVGDTVTWNYEISNTGNVPLLNVLVVDSKEGTVTDCTGDGSLNPLSSITCTKVGTAILGAYSNSATVMAQDDDENNVTDNDEGSYIGKETPVELGSIGNFIWLDSNRDGLQESTELGVSGVVVTLFDSNHHEIGSTKTDALGHYLFLEVVAGDYYVQFSVPNGYNVTIKNQRDNNLNSDADSSGKTDTFTLGVGENITFKDMGLYPSLVLLGNRVWYDTNQNGIQENREQDSVADVTVKLYGEDGTFIKETKTRASGLYEFKDLVAGQYHVIFEIPNNYKVSPQNQGTNDSSDSDVDIKTGKSDMVTLVAGVDNRTVDMGLYQEAGKVGDRVWYDANKNGLQDKGEHGVGNVTVKLYRVGENEPVAETKTSATGIYSFEKVTPSEYYILFTIPRAYSITDVNKGADRKLDSNADKNGRTENFTVVSGTQNSTVDMGVYQNMVSFGDRVWLDTNQDGLQSKGEVGVKEIKVIISSAVSDFTKTVLTDENGNYLFTHLSAGEYSVEFTDIPLGYLITKRDVNENNSDLNDSDVFTNDDKKHVTPVALLTPGKNDLSWDLGLYKTVLLPGKASVGDLVWDDYNKNGVQDIGESGIANVTVTLFNNDTDEKIKTLTTDENGLYEFAHLDPEFNYYIQFTIPAGYVTSPQDQDDDILDSDVDENGKTDVISLIGNQVNSTVDMGLHHEGSAIGDKVWFDEKNGVSNGLQDEGENGVDDVVVTLYTSNGDEVQTTQTNASGAYHFTNIPKGRYTIGFSNLPTGYIFTSVDQGVDKELDSDANLNGRTAVITINGIQNITHIDAGIKTLNKGESTNDIKRGVTGNNVTIDVLANDVEGTYAFDASTVKIISALDGSILSEDGKTLTVPNEGVWSVNGTTGAITFTPNKGFVGDPTSITYSVGDSQGNETGAEVEVNYPPVANDDTVNAQIGKTVIVYVTDNDTNTSSPLDKPSVRIIDSSNGDEVESIIVESEGTWSTNNDGSISFIPLDELKNNPKPMEYVVREQEGDVSNRATVTIVYPDAVDDIVNVPANHEGEISVDVIANDSNNTIPSSITLGCNLEGIKTLIIKNEGVWTVNENYIVTFTANNGFTGEPKDIQYTVALISGERSNCATIDVRYELLARDDSGTLNIGNVSLINILNNDFGSLNPESVRLAIPTNPPKETTLQEDGKRLTVPYEGVWSVDNRGVVTLTTEEGFVTNPTPIKYTVENSNEERSNEATITFTQGGLLIVANDDIGMADAGNTIIIHVLENDIGDINTSTVFLIAPNGSYVRTLEVEDEGTWRANEDGTVTFTGFSGYIGTPTPIQYVVSDNNGEQSSPATITITGTCVCTPYEANIPVMGKIATLLMVFLTLLVGGLLFKEDEKNFN